MGTPLFGVDISGIIAQTMGNGNVPRGTLIRAIPGTRDPADSTGGTRPTERRHPFDGFYEKLSFRFQGDSRVLASDSQVTIIGDSLPSGIVPLPGDQIELTGRTMSVIVMLEGDPAQATYLCAVR